MSSTINPLPHDSFESFAGRLAVAFLQFLGLAAGALLLLFVLIDGQSPTWILVVGAAMAIGTILISWRPFMFLVVGWCWLLGAACAFLLSRFPDTSAPDTLQLLLGFVGLAFFAGGFLELWLGLGRRPPRRIWLVVAAFVFAVILFLLLPGSSAQELGTVAA